MPARVALSDIPRAEHRALVEAGYAPLDEYVALYGHERTAAPASGRVDPFHEAGDA